MSSTPVPDWSLSVVSHGHLPGVRLLVQDMARYLDPQHYELLLTLNLGESPEDVQSLWPGRITVISNSSPRGFAANHNAAFAHARGRCFAAIDPELRLHGDPFPMLAAALQAPEVGITCTRVLDESGETVDNARSVPTPSAILGRRFSRGRRSRIYGRDLDQVLSVDWIAGLFMAMRADTFRRLQGFDERYYLYCEDADLCMRAWNAGLQVRVVPAVPVTHVAQRQTLKKLRHFVWHCQSLVRLWRAPSYRMFRARKGR